MLNYVEGGTTLLFSTFDKTQYLWRYSAKTTVKVLIFRHCAHKKPIFSKSIVKI